MSSIAVRIPREAHAKIQSIAKERHSTVGSVIAEWAELHEEEQFWANAREAIRRVQEDPEAWESLKKEQRLYEGTLMDGLE